MLKNYLKTSLRNLLRFKSYSFINIFGLTIGLAASIFIFLWVMDEVNYDQFHENDNIYRVMSNFTYSGGTIETGWASPLPLGEAMQQEIPEIDQVARMGWNNELLFKYGEKSVIENGMYADSSIFSIFTFPIVKGDPRNPIPGITSVAISEKMAEKFFKGKDPIGKVFLVNQRMDLMVSAVFKNVPSNSSIPFDFIIPFTAWERENNWWANEWGNNSLQTYASLKPGASLEAANEKMYGIISKHCKDCICNPFLYPLKDFRLHAEFKNGKSVGGRIDYVVSFSLVALIILFIACINFMNLATARASTRSREVGVRKSVGAQRTGIIVQFLSESIMLTVFAMIFAITIVEVGLPFFNLITEKNIRPDFTDPIFVTGIVSITLVTGVLAGSYPALFLSSFKPATVLKGNASATFSGESLRKILVITQFVASTILIVGSIVVYNQIAFIRNTKIGFDRENIVVLSQHAGYAKNSAAFRNELLQHTSIKNVGVTAHNPFAVGNTTTDPVWPGKPSDAMISFKVITCDQGFIPTMGMEMAAGRNFTDENQADSSNYIINEKSLEVMGLTLETAVGSDLDMWRGKGKIIGVVRDFNNGNLKEAIMPLIFVNNPGNTWRLFIKISGNTKEALAHIERVYHKYDPDYPFAYSFLNEEFDLEYRSEAMIGKLSLSFTVIAILISCLGLFGLAAFTAERRMKELGVRKVLGATALNLIALLCTDFTKLVSLALLLSFPAAWYLTKEYLEGYNFHTELTVWVFAGPAVGILLLTLITVGYQSAKAAMSNPVNALRSE